MSGSTGHTAQAPPLALGHAAPNAKALVVSQRVFQAFFAHLAGLTNSLSLASGAALFGEKRLRIRLRTQSVLLPRKGAVNAGVQCRVGILGPLEGSVTEDVPQCGSSL